MKIIAAAPNDGCGIVANNNEIHLFVSPYDKAAIITQQDVKNLVLNHGYDPCDIECDTIDEVIVTLKTMYVNSKAGVPPSIDAKKFLEYAPDEVLFTYLNRALDELIPAGMLDEADELVLDLMGTDRMHDNPEMIELAKKVLVSSEMVRRRREEK